MSADCIYRVWVDLEDDQVVVRTVSCSTNVSPKPTGYELTKSCSDIWKTFPVSVSEIRDWVTRLGSGYDGGSLFEPGERGHNVQLSKVWNRWRTRFKKGAGIDIGDMPHIGKLRYSDSIESGLPVGFPEEETIRFTKGQIITRDEATRLLKLGITLDVQVEYGRMEGHSLIPPVFRGRLGFLSDECPCVYGTNYRRRGHSVGEDCALRVRVATTITRTVKAESRVKPTLACNQSYFERDDLFAILNFKGEVFAGSDWRDGYRWAPVAEAYCNSFQQEFSAGSKKPSGVAFVSREEADKAIQYYQAFNPDEPVRSIPAREFSDIATVQLIAA